MDYAVHQLQHSKDILQNTHIINERILQQQDLILNVCSDGEVRVNIAGFGMVI
jgi:hypothetical protein